ncbi:unnamed protein product, partial [marine sediment metagenome]
WIDWVTGFATIGAAWSDWVATGGRVKALGIRLVATTIDSGGVGESICGEVEVRYA